MTNKLSVISITLLLVFVSSASQAEVYKWVDTNGNVNFSDVKPASIKAEKISGSDETFIH